MQNDNSNNNNENEALYIEGLGKVSCITELRSSRTDTHIGTPAMIGEEALLFFAWQEGDR